ncbi:MAG: leucine-rich repeat protein, partial [Alistipes sp.]|nr:leucine-rich repeat protein [Alistipes sp.]
MEAAPSYGGSVNNSQLNVEADHEVYCRAYEKTGYRFKQWMVGDSLVSTEASFYFKMPAEDVVLIAYFDYVGYDPENPADPEAPGDDPVAEKSYNVTVYATPSVGGYFNSSSFWLKEGEEANVYAYPQNGYRFVSWKQNGVIISTDNPLRVVMDTLNLAYTATFVYDPMSPDNPGSNNFNPATGEVVIDKFSAGNLNSTLSNTIGGSENYSLVQSIVIVGRMNSYDFGFSHNFNNCSLIDLSRTTGYTEIPSWGFEGMSSLTKLLLPSTVERIGNGAFNGCSNLSELICYAAVPPALDPNAFASSVGLVVRVPLSAMSLYQAADGWKELAILPLDEDTYQLNVSLPADAADGRYKNMTLELNNISSGQTLRYIITDRTTYAFANLISGTKYNVLVKNASNAVLGTIFDIKVDKADVNVAFESLLQPQNVVVRLLTPDNVDVSSQATIKWYDEEKRYLSQGIELKGILEDSKINYQVTLSNDLAMQYVAPQDAEYIVRSSDNTIVMTLMPFEEVLLTGRVNNATTGTGVYNAAVTFSQTLNGKYTKSVVAKTDTAGVFSATIYNVACDVVVAAYDYISQTLHFDDLSNVEALNGIQLQEITGVRISTAFTYKGSIAEDEVANVQDGYDDQANVSYTIYNKTTQKTINDFNVQSPYIVLLEEVSEGDVLSITAKSRTNAFKDVTADGVVDANNRVEVTFPIVEWGKLQASYNQSASNRVVGILYNAKGELQNKFSYSDSKLTIEGLQDGTYTLVTMEGSDFFNSILNLSELSNAGLIEGTHYVKHDVTIQTGKITSLSINNVPEFDDSQFYYTGNNTQFTVNKQSVTVGNYVTLRAKVDFKSKYADKVSDVKLVVDLPESCEFVDNSVMVGTGTSSYSVGKNRVIVELANADDVVRFCVIPNEGGYCNPNAFVQFNFDGKEVLQPIGIAEFEAESMRISVPEITSLTSVVVNGVATADSEVRIYDNGVLVGTTYSLANGQWSSKVELYKPYSKSYHSFYAEITAPDGQKFTTANKLLEFDKNYVSLSKVSMIYGSTVIDFDPVERKNSTNTYSYVPGNDDFTFTVEFTNTDTSLVKNMELVVLASDGTTRTLEPEYNSAKNLWVAKSKYGNSNKLPVNVKVNYTNTVVTPLFDEEREYDEKLIFDGIIQEMLSAYEAGEVSLITNTPDELYFSVVPMGYDNPEYYRVKKETYSDIIQLYGDANIFTIVNDTIDCGGIQDFTNDCYKLFFWNNKTEEAFSLHYTGTKVYRENGDVQRILPVILAGAAGIAMAVAEYYIVLPEIESWYQTIDMEMGMWNKNVSTLWDFLYATCEDGTYKIKEGYKIETYRASITEWQAEINQYIKEFRQIVDLERQRHKNRCTLEGAISVGLSAIGGAISGIRMLTQQPVLLGLSGKTTGVIAEQVVPAANAAANEAVAYGIGEVLGQVADAGYPRRDISKWYVDKSKQLSSFFCNTVQSIKSDYSSCEEEEDEEEDE